MIFCGSQYDWLAVFALDHKGIELSIHEDDKAISLIKKYGRINQVEDDICGTNYLLDLTDSPKNLITIFKDYHFPLAEVTKLDMRKQLIDWGYEDIIKETWFCHTPYHGKPCGRCNPCIYTIEEGMQDRIPFIGRVKYHLHKLYVFLKKK